MHEKPAPILPRVPGDAGADPCIGDEVGDGVGGAIPYLTPYTTTTLHTSFRYPHILNYDVARSFPDLSQAFP
jgi:hypothetical protein